MKEANKIAKHIIDISGIDVFDNTRKREHIEMRSLLTFMLRHHCNMKFKEIKDFYESNGKNYDHATALHSLKSFETHRRYNPKLDKYFDIDHESFKRDVVLDDKARDIIKQIFSKNYRKLMYKINNYFK